MIHGASDLILEVFEEAGRYAQMAVGVVALPYDVAVEVEAIFEVSEGGSFQTVGDESGFGVPEGEGV